MFRDLSDPDELYGLLILFGDVILDVEGLQLNFAKGGLNARPSFSLFTLVVICTFLDWSIETSFTLCFCSKNFGRVKVFQ